MSGFLSNLVSSTKAGSAAFMTNLRQNTPPPPAPDAPAHSPDQATFGGSAAAPDLGAQLGKMASNVSNYWKSNDLSTMVGDAQTLAKKSTEQATTYVHNKDFGQMATDAKAFVVEKKDQVVAGLAQPTQPGAPNGGAGIRAAIPLAQMGMPLLMMAGVSPLVAMAAPMVMGMMANRQAAPPPMPMGAPPPPMPGAFGQQVQAPGAPQVRETNLPNGVQISQTFQGNSLAHMEALLPGQLGSGNLLPAPMLVHAQLNPQTGSPEYTATFVDKQKQPLLGPDGNPHVMQGHVVLDGNIYFSADEKNPNSPLMMFSEDGAYGVSSPLLGDGNPNPAGIPLYHRDKLETVESDGTRVMKFNETTYAPQPAFGGIMAGLQGGPPKVGHTYSEVRQNPQGKITAAKVDEQVAPFHRSTPAKIMGNMNSGVQSRNETPRVAHFDPNSRSFITEQAPVYTKLLGGLLGKGDGRTLFAGDSAPERLQPLSASELATPESAANFFGPQIANELRAAQSNS